jgi:hypothetical protein
VARDQFSIDQQARVQHGQSPLGPRRAGLTCRRPRPRGCRVSGRRRAGSVPG